MTRPLRICVVYDCLYPWTVGGHERWLRQLAEHLAGAGHKVTFLTRLQWDADATPDIPGVRVVAVSPREELYDEAGNRRSGPPVRFGLGVLRHLARHRRDYDVVHTCGFPYFHIPAIRLALARTSIPVFVDWPEIWSAAYWRRYSGLVAGLIGVVVQALCVRLTPIPVAYSRTHGERLRRWGARRDAVRPGGLGPDPVEVTPRVDVAGPPVVLFAGRHIREKRAGLVVEAAGVARHAVPDLHATVLGKGPESDAIKAAATRAGEWVDVPGFVSRERVEQELRDAAVFLLPSEREGFGIVVLEAAAIGTPVVVVAGPDNAASELIEPGVNGFVAADASPATVGASVAACVAGGAGLRRSTAAWYADNAARLSATRTAEALDAEYSRVVMATFTPR